MKTALAAIVALSFAAAGANAAQVSLTPASVIGSSGYYTGCCSFQPGNIFDQQTGSVTESFGGGYWLNPDNGPANAFITVDLGAATALGSIELFNTHNGGYNDRGTGSFLIEGSNSVTDLGGGNFALVSPTTIVSGTLAATNSGQATVPGQSFAASGVYRYISFDPTGVATSGGSCCGANNYGLDELRVFAASAPEPTSWALMLVGLGAAGASLRSRRRVATV